MKVSTQELVGILADIKQRVESGDSFEGNFEYTCMAEGLQRGEWEVSGAYRVGNTLGQGGMAVFEA